MENKQNIFQTFQSSSRKEFRQNASLSFKQKPQGKTFTKIQNCENALQKNLSFDSFGAKSYSTTFFSSIPLLKKCVTHEEIPYYTTSSKQELLELVYRYLNEILTNQSSLKDHIKNMSFQTLQKNSVWVKDFSQNQSYKQHGMYQPGVKNNSSQLCSIPENQQNEQNHVQLNVFNSIEDYLSDTNLTKSISIQISKSTENHQITLSPSKQLPGQKNERHYLDTVDEVKSQNFTLSNTSFGQFQQKTLLKKNKNLLQQVSIYLQKSQLCNNSQKSQISLQICPSLRSSGWSQLSSDEFSSFSDIKREISIQFSLQFIDKLYGEPEPFLITISLIYLLKYLYHTQKTLTDKNITLLLSMSLLIAYKIYYDQQLLGLVDYLTQTVFQNKLSKQQFLKLERYYLHSLEYQAVISNQQFYKMLKIVGGLRDKTLQKV